MKRLITILFSMFTLLQVAASQTSADRTSSFRFYFAFGDDNMVSDSEVNRLTVAAVDQFMAEVSKQGLRIESIDIKATASPEGTQRYNRGLAGRRGASAARFLVERYSVEQSIIAIHNKGIGWTILRDSVAVSGMHNAERVVNIIDNVPEAVFRNGRLVDSKKKQLMELNYGRTYNYMIRRWFGSMRRVSVTFNVAEVEALPSEEPAEPTVEVVEPIAEVPATEVETVAATEEQAPEVVPATAEEQVKEAEERSLVVNRDPPPIRQKKNENEDIVPNQPEAAKAAPIRFALGLKTNILYDIALTPNIAAEVAFGRDFAWSIEAEAVYAWWRNDAKHNYWRIGYSALELRRYMGDRAERRPLSGWYLGLYGAWGRYDFEFGGDGQLSDSAFSFGLSAGYSLPLARRWNLEFGLAAGYIGGEYKTYRPDADCYVWQGTYRRKINNIKNWSLTRARVALVWTFGEAAK